MHFQRIEIDGFGQLRGSCTFPVTGLSLYLDRNESGKSTLASALLFTLYGIPDGRTLKEIVERGKLYTPWKHQTFRSALEVTLGGAEYRIIRDFNSRSVRVIEAKTQRDRTADFNPGRRDETGLRMTGGLSVLEALQTLFVHPAELSASSTRTTLTAQIQKLAGSATGDTSLAKAIQVLEASVQKYPFPVATSAASLDNEYRKLQEAITAKRKELNDLKTEYEKQQTVVDRLKSAGDELKALEDMDVLLERTRLIDELNAIQVRMRESEETEAEWQEKTTRVSSLRQFETVPYNSNEVYVRIQNSIDTIEESLRNLRTRKGLLEERKAQLERELTDRGAVHLSSELAAEFRLIRDEFLICARTVQETEDKLRTVDDKFSGMGLKAEVVVDREEKWKSLNEADEELLLTLRPTTEQYVAQHHERQSMLQRLKEDLDELTMQSELWSKRKVRFPFIALLYFITTSVSLYFTPLPEWSKWLLIVAPAGYLLRLGNRARLQSKVVSVRHIVLREEIAAKKTELETMEGEYKRLNDRIAEIGKRLGMQGNKDLTEAFRQRLSLLPVLAERQRIMENLSDLQRRLEQFRSKLIANMKSLKLEIDDHSFDPEVLSKLDRDWDLMLQRQHDLLVSRDELLKCELSLRDNEQKLTELREEQAKQHQSLSIPDGYSGELAIEWLRNAVNGRNELERLLNTELPALETKRTTEEQRHSLQDRLAFLIAKVGNAVNEANTENQLDREAINHKRDTLQQEISQLNIGLDRFLDRWSQFGRIESELLQLEQAERRASSYRTAVTATTDLLREIQDSLHSRWATRLNEVASETIRHFDGNCDSLQFAADLSVEARLSDGRLLREDEWNALSTGVRDQIHLAMRMAWVDALSKVEPLPVILDEPFAFTDDERFESGMSTLASLAAQRQIIVFSCHENRYRAWMSKHSDEAALLQWSAA